MSASPRLESLGIPAEWIALLDELTLRSHRVLDLLDDQLNAGFTQRAADLVRLMASVLGDGWDGRDALKLLANSRQWRAALGEQYAAVAQALDHAAAVLARDALDFYRATGVSVSPGADGLSRLAAIRRQNLTEISKGQPVAERQVRDGLRRLLATGPGAGTTAQLAETMQQALALPAAQARSAALTAAMGETRTLNRVVAEQAGIDRFLYYGPLDRLARPFCRAHVNRVFSRLQIDEMDNGQVGPVFTYAGGYRCRHQLVAVPDGFTP